MVVKSIILLSLYFVPFILFLYSNPDIPSTILLWSLMAVGMAGIGMSIMHDAQHHAYTYSHRINEWIGQSILLIGGFGYNWKIQHNFLHHTYTNISDYDDDIDDKSILKLSPKNSSKWYHRYQHYYAFLFYSIATLYWCTIKDILQMIRYRKEGHNRLSHQDNISMWAKLLVTRILYFVLFLGVPTWIFHIPLEKVLIGFISMHLLAGLILTVVFQLAHTVEGTRHPTPSEDGKMDMPWAVHQMYTTVNFAPNNPLISWYVGGLNYQIEHHLFPNVCHVHYPRIAPIIQSCATEYHIPYKAYPTLASAIRAHIEALRLFAE